MQYTVAKLLLYELVLFLLYSIFNSSKGLMAVSILAISVVEQQMCGVK